MRNSGYRHSLWLLGGLFLLWSCEDPTQVGSDLLGEDDLSLSIVDDLALSAQTVASDPLIAFTRINFFNTSFLMGQLDDPVFGRSESSIYFEFRPQINNPPDFSGARFDSLVLTMNFAASGIYGDIDAAHDIEVFRLTERMDALDTILTNSAFAFNTPPVGVKTNYRGGPEDSITIYDPAIDTTRTLSGVLRMRLDDEFGKELFQNPSASEDTDTFLDLVPGLYMRSDVDGSSLLSFDLSINTEDGAVQLYYTIGQDTTRVYNYLLNANRSTRFTHFEHDFEGTPVSDVIEEVAVGDAPLYMQGMEGVNMLMDLSAVKDLDDIFINHAKLEFFVAEELLGDTSIYALPVNLAVMREGDDGTLVVVDDLLTGILNNGIDRFFGGGQEIDEQLGVRKYAMNITNHVKQIYNDQESPYIYITVFDKVQNPQRIIVFGPEHSKYPAKLMVTYTNP